MDPLQTFLTKVKEWEENLYKKQRAIESKERSIRNLTISININYREMYEVGTEILRIRERLWTVKKAAYWKKRRRRNSARLIQGIKDEYESKSRWIERERAEFQKEQDEMRKELDNFTKLYGFANDGTVVNKEEKEAKFVAKLTHVQKMYKDIADFKQAIKDCDALEEELEVKRKIVDEMAKRKEELEEIFAIERGEYNVIQDDDENDEGEGGENASYEPYGEGDDYQEE